MFERHEMGKVIFIMGDIAAGKSTYAKHLSSKYKMPFFLKDTFKEELSNSVGYIDRPSNRKLSEGVFLTMIEISKRLMEQNISFILESNFRQEELNEYKKIVDEFKYDSITIFLQGDMETIHKRYLERMDGRHETHMVVDLRKFEDFQKLILETRKTIPFGKVVILDATNFDFYEQNILDI